MDNNELYHYGVPGMRWGHRKATVSSSPKKRKTNKEASSTKKAKMSKGKKIAIGSAVAVTALAGVGTILARNVITEKANILLVGKAIAENMW